MKSSLSLYADIFKKRFKIIAIFLMIIALIFSFALIGTGCDKINGEIFGSRFGQEVETGTGSETQEDVSGISDEDSIKEDTGDSTTKNNVQETDANAWKNEDNSGKNQNVESLDENGDIPESPGTQNYSQEEIEQFREYFKEAVNYFQDDSFLIAEYYLNKIKDGYVILQDHIFYYLAKSLLMQQKYDQSKEYYLKLVENYSDSIWREKSVLELADLFYVTEDYVTAEEKYSAFVAGYSESEYYPYAAFQLAVCQEKNEKFSEAAVNYKDIWRNYPASEYAGFAMDNINRLSEGGFIESYIPTAQEIFGRAEIFFNLYLYQNALQEYDSIINSALSSQITTELVCRILFKIGMCYYNLRDYESSRNYLLKSYQKSASSSVADDSLYFLGRVFTNLNQTEDATAYYQKLLSDFPGSNFADDSLYRMGRIYISRDDYSNAITSFKKVFESYPGGDKILDSLWELGWAEYKAEDFNSAKSDFSQLASAGKETLLEEKGLFWQAKCFQKLGQTEAAVNLCKEIINLRTYSYYTFAAKILSGNLGAELQIPDIDTNLNPNSTAIKNIIPEIFTNIEKDVPGTDGKTDHISRALELVKIEYYSSASLEIEAGSSELSKNPVKILELATLYSKANDYGSSVKIVNQNKNAISSGGLEQAYVDYSYYLLYPYAFAELVDKYGNDYGLESLFILSVIRQESSFKQDAGSYAGAMGLMQIMPATGKSIAGRIGISGFDSSMLFDPETNINMGTYYLKEQLNSFNQNKIFCLGAYNGGPGAMMEWISRWGNLDQDEFIENIPYLETKDYIKRVMGNYYFYQFLY